MTADAPVSDEELIENLLDRLDVDESVDLEYKTCRDKVPDGLWESVAAFANTGGGVVVLGVREAEGQPLEITGVQNVRRLFQQVSDQLRNPQKVSVEVGAGEAVSAHRLRDRDVILVRVRRATAAERPVYVGSTPYGGTYLRRHAGDYRATKPEVDRMMREASPIPADGVIVEGTDLGDIDADSLARYRQRYRTEHPTSPFLSYDDLRFLRALQCFDTDPASRRAGLTVAGLLMFGSQESILRWRRRHLIDYRLTVSPGVERWDDRLVWEGNLLGAFERLYPRLVQDLPRPFRLEGPYRVDVGPLHIAIREALVNLLVHADYSERSASIVRRSTRLFEFRNPGASLAHDLGLDGPESSVPRNPTLVRLFRFIGLADEGGTGLPKIYRAWGDSELRPPRIDPGLEQNEFRLHLDYVDLLSPEHRSWLVAVAPLATRDERLALLHALEQGAVDNAALRRLTGLHAADATRVLAGLRSSGLLVMEGARRSATYRLGPRADSHGGGVDLEGTDASDLEGDDTVSPCTDGRDLHGDDTDVHGATTPDMHDERPDMHVSPDDRRSRGTVEDAAALDHATLPPALASRAERVRASPRGDRAQIQRVIVDLCSWRPMTRREVASLLGRTETYLRTLIGELVERGDLQMTQPDRPRTRSQAYRAARRTEAAAGPSENPDR